VDSHRHDLVSAGRSLAAAREVSFLYDSGRQRTMEFPSLPTDSVYKFQAVAGIVLMLAAAVLPRQYADSYRQKAREMQLASEKLKIEVTHLEKEIARQTQRLDYLHRSTKALDDSIPTLNPRRKRDRDVVAVRMKLIAEQREEIDAAATKIDTATYEARLKTAALEGSYRETKDLQADAKEAISESRFMLNLGASLSLIGFICWFWYVQRYQDEILKGQALALRANPRRQRSRPRRKEGRLLES
jgi:hypothetical protein